ncbi:Zinc finger, CCHC-type [Quillaja saponaria]|uniref:Zinc finger, CCHC-type n=1 Tax=Quillaja saponaria TaxID=32244 RepID=A0AAD7QJL5_QUISA|nr:Zinc finger, CCHC-type [Quillaja saponaria]
MDFHSLSRKELQALCKKNKIPANITNVAMAEALKALQHVEGLDELLNPNESNSQQVPATPDTHTACRTSIRRKPIKEDSECSMQSLPRRGAREAAAEGTDQENKDLNVPETPAMPSNRRRGPAASTRRKKETQMGEDEKKEGQQKSSAVLETPAAPASRRRAAGLTASRKIETPIEGSSVQRAYSTRRSVRLLEKNMSKMDLLDDTEKTEPLTIDEISEETSCGTEISYASVEVKKGAGIQADSDLNLEKNDDLEVTSLVKSPNASEEFSEGSDESGLHLNKTLENAVDVNNATEGKGTESLPEDLKSESRNYSSDDVEIEFSLPSANINSVKKCESSEPETHGCLNVSETNYCLNHEVKFSEESEFAEFHLDFEDQMETDITENLEAKAEPEIEFEEYMAIVPELDTIGSEVSFEKNANSVENSIAGDQVSMESAEEECLMDGSDTLEAKADSAIDIKENNITESDCSGACSEVLFEKSATSLSIAGDHVSGESAEEESINVKAMVENDVDKAEDVSLENLVANKVSIKPEENLDFHDFTASSPSVVKLQHEDENNVGNPELPVTEFSLKKFPADQLAGQFPRPTQMTPKVTCGEKQVFQICEEIGNEDNDDDGEVEAEKIKANAYNPEDLSLRQLRKEYKKLALANKGNAKDVKVANKVEIRRIPLQENRVAAGEESRNGS